MKLFFVSSLILLFSHQSFSQEHIIHQCVPRKQDADISIVNIVHSPGHPFAKEFLEVFDKDGLILKIEVEYADDMTYIAYVNLEADIYFDREWPDDENGRGYGQLMLGAFGDPKQKIYALDCETKN